MATMFPADVTSFLTSGEEATYSFLQRTARPDGKPLLPCPVTGGAVLPHISREEFRAAGLGEVMEEGRIIFWDELHEESPLRRDASGRSFACWLAEHFPPLFPFQLSGSQIDWLRARIFPVVRLELPVRGGAQASAQDETIRALDRDQENLARGMGAGKQLIIGPSGSGKTLILAHQAWNLPRVDKKIRRVLVTCFNLSLVGYIRRLLARKGASLGPDGVEVVPFYSVCERILGEPLTHAEESAYYDLIVQEAQERLQGEHPLKGHWDAILVDEGQDFSPEMAQVLLALLPPHGVLTVAQDEQQCLYQPEDSGWEKMGIAGLRLRRLRRQYRNTRAIARMALRLLPEGGTGRRGRGAPLLAAKRRCAFTGARRGGCRGRSGTGGRTHERDSDPLHPFPHGRSGGQPAGKPAGSGGGPGRHGPLGSPGCDQQALFRHHHGQCLHLHHPQCQRSRFFPRLPAGHGASPAGEAPPAAPGLCGDDARPGASDAGRLRSGRARPLAGRGRTVAL